MSRKADATPGGQGGPNSAHQKMAERRAPGHIPSGVTFGAIDMQDGADRTITGTSVFDPVLCELVYRWFSAPGDLVLDPFAGGSVRGVVASKLGRRYLGVDLSERQIEANYEQSERICDEPSPHWIVGDSRELDALAPQAEADLVFTCPPYADLERYSDDPRDLSTFDYPAFREGYRQVIAQAVARLKQDRFAVIVVGDARGKDGFYYGFPWHTVEAFEAAGARLYNEAVLLTAIGSLPVRTRIQFERSRKFGKTHQNVLVFCKGDAWKATARLGAVDFGGADQGEGTAPVATGPLPHAEAVEQTAPQPATFEAVRDQTLIEYVCQDPPFFVKRDDYFQVAGMRGGKVRTCLALAAGAEGLVTAGSRSSPQCNIVAHIGQALGIPTRLHCPSGELGPELEEAAHCRGAEIVQHRPGYNNVIIARAREDAAERGWREIPFGMECWEAIKQTAGQVDYLPAGCERIVMPVGSGMSLAGVLHGLAARGLSVPVLGVVVGADPTKRLDKYAPPHWRDLVRLIPSGLKYEHPARPECWRWYGIELDPIYEAKCVPWLEPCDLFWIVGIRGAVDQLPERRDALALA